MFRYGLRNPERPWHARPLLAGRGTAPPSRSRRVHCLAARSPGSRRLRRLAARDSLSFERATLSLDILPDLKGRGFREAECKVARFLGGEVRFRVPRRRLPPNCDQGRALQRVQPCQSGLPSRTYRALRGDEYRSSLHGGVFSPHGTAIRVRPVGRDVAEWFGVDSGFVTMREVRAKSFETAKPSRDDERREAPFEPLWCSQRPRFSTRELR